MGYGNYSHEAHQAITQARTAMAREEVFRQTIQSPVLWGFTNISAGWFF